MVWARCFEGFTVRATDALRHQLRRQPYLTQRADKLTGPALAALSRCSCICISCLAVW